ncbi:hypothetical protein RI367_002114 [Sorochytrium milnesiophthora]
MSTFRHPTRIYRRSVSTPLLPVESLALTSALVRSKSSPQLSSSGSNSRADRVRLPNELILLIFSHLPDQALFRMRRASSSFNAMASWVLVERLERQAQEWRELARDAQQSFINIEIGTLPALSHNLRFLRQIPVRQITDLGYLKTPHNDILKITECLLRLHGSFDESQSATRGQSHKAAMWVTMKKALLSRSLRDWLCNLRHEVSGVSYASVMDAHRILERMHVTYEHMKSINFGAYHMLVVVAAIIQFRLNHETLEKARSTMTSASDTLWRTERCLGFAVFASGRSTSTSTDAAERPAVQDASTSFGDTLIAAIALEA